VKVIVWIPDSVILVSRKVSPVPTAQDALWTLDPFWTRHTGKG
jgi:hypothetical protein